MKYKRGDRVLVNNDILANKPAMVWNVKKDGLNLWFDIPHIGKPEDYLDTDWGLYYFDEVQPDIERNNKEMIRSWILD